MTSTKPNLTVSLDKIKPFLMLLLFISLAVLSFHAFADDGTDILQGTDSSAWSTLNGTGKKYIYMIEGVSAVAGYIKSKNLLVFTGILAVAIFINIIIKIAAGH